MNHSQVALHTGQEVEQSFSEEGEVQNSRPNSLHLPDIIDATQRQHDETDKLTQLHDDGVIREKVGGTWSICWSWALSPSALEAQVEDVDEDRKDEEDVDHDESREDVDACF